MQDYNIQKESTLYLVLRIGSGTTVTRTNGQVIGDFNISNLCADLHNVDLTGADLRGVDLTGANLSGVVLRLAWFHNATLTNATFAEVNLVGADLTGATLTNCIGSGYYDALTLFPPEFNPTGANWTFVLEPASATLLLLGLAGLSACRRRSSR